MEKEKTKIQNITYLEEYTEKNKKRDFELQKIRVQNMELENMVSMVHLINM